MWELDHKEGWAPNNICFCTVVLKNTCESLRLESKPVNPKGNQSWIFTGNTDAEAPVHWPPDMKNCLVRKEPDAGKDWRQNETEMAEYEMVGCHHQLSGHEFEQNLGDHEGQGSLVCCSSWGHKESSHAWSTEQQQSE